MRDITISVRFYVSIFIILLIIILILFTKIITFFRNGFSCFYIKAN